MVKEVLAEQPVRNFSWCRRCLERGVRPTPKLTARFVREGGVYFLRVSCDKCGWVLLVKAFSRIIKEAVEEEATEWKRSKGYQW